MFAYHCAVWICFNCLVCFTESASLKDDNDGNNDDSCYTVADDVDNGQKHISPCLNSSLCNCSINVQQAQVLPEKQINCSEGKSALTYITALLFDVVFVVKVS